MSVNNFEDLLSHEGHEIVCVTYSLLSDFPRNVAVECETCSTVILDFDVPDLSECFCVPGPRYRNHWPDCPLAS